MIGLKTKLLNWLLPAPVQARHAEFSMIMSLDDEIGRPSPYLLEVALKASAEATNISLAEISARLSEAPLYTDVWPGEHYKLLAGLVKVLQPNLVVEIGTAAGLSALSLKKFLAPTAKVATFDIVPWQQFPGAVLQAGDFADGMLVQHVSDISDKNTCNQYAPLLSQAELIFMDAAKDGMMEQKILDNFKTISFVRPPLIVFDDIRVWNMLKIWRLITMPKIDLTSFGHWSGTGLVQWTT